MTKLSNTDIHAANQEALASMCPEMFMATASTEPAVYGTCDTTPLDISQEDREFLRSMDHSA